MVAAILFPDMLAAQGSNPAKLNELVAAAHYYVVSFTSWPKPGEVKICILGEGPLNQTLISVFTNRSSSDRRYLVETIDGQADIIARCDALIIWEESANIDSTLRQIEGRPILTISSGVDLVLKGGMVFLPQGKPPKVHLERVTRSGLKIDAALLEISEIVK